LICAISPFHSVNSASATRFTPVTLSLTTFAWLSLCV
jgi:hypothetical protein